jgi:hypothetical protein
MDDRLTVSHIQSRGLAGMVDISWHSARAAAGTRRQRITPFEVLRMLAAPVSPLVYAALIASAVARRRYAPLAFVASSPLLMGFLGVRAVAEIVGYVAGPGDSLRGFP